MSATIDITGILDLDITTNGIGATASQCTPTQGANLTTPTIQNCTTVDCTTVDCTTINCTTIQCTTIDCTTIQCGQCVADAYDIHESADACKD